MTQTLLNNPTIVTLIGIILTSVVGYLGYRRGMKADKGVEKVASEVAKNVAVNQVVEGLDNLVDSLQEENREQRLVIRELRDRFMEVAEESYRCGRELRRLKLKYGNGDNGVVK